MFEPLFVLITEELIVVLVTFSFALSSV